MASDIADILEKAAELIEPEGAWTQGTWARGPSGAPCSPHDPDAACFCLRGAMVRVASLPLTAQMARHHNAMGFRSGASAALWNDTDGRTLSEVVARLREAAAKAREQSA